MQRSFIFTRLKKVLWASIALACLLPLNPGPALGDDEEEDQEASFENFEIRVIRPRYFNKRHRFEFGIESSIVTNNDFTYSFLFGGGIAFHLSETLAIETRYNYGVLYEKEDKDTIVNVFDIKPNLSFTQQVIFGGLSWTPIYGKFQLSDGAVFYFDTFIGAGGGLGDITYLHEDCDPRPLNPPETVSFPGFYANLGQRYYIDKSSSFNWRFDWQGIVSDANSSRCPTARGASETALIMNLNVVLGYSYFL